MLNILKLSLVMLLAGLTIAIAQPKLEIEGGGTYDWGNVKPEQGMLHAKVKLYNKGDKTLTILRTKPGCGCTTDSLDINSVPPGKYATLGINLSIKGYQGNTMKSVRISTNDPERPEQTLMIKCNVVVPVAMIPKYLSFNRLIVGEEATTKSIITNNTDKPIKIVNFSINMSTQEIQATELKHNVRRNTIIAPKGNLTVEMKYNPKKAGRLQAALIIDTDSKEAPKLDLPIYGNIIEEQTGKK